MSEQPKKAQLQMIWPAARLDDPPVWPPPDGYALRPARPGDETAYADVLKEAGLVSWDASQAAAQMEAALPDGLVFAVCESDGAVVATAIAQPKPTELHPSGGELGWVAVATAHRGKGLGGCVSVAATRRFIEEGFRDIYLRTHDYRLPAIKTYLKMGYVPLLFTEGMDERWRDVCRELDVDYDALETFDRPVE